VRPQVSRRFLCVAAPLAACVLALSACGGGNATGGNSGQVNAGSALARQLRAASQAGLVHLEFKIARCVRARGVSDYPNPNSHGVLPPAQLSAIQRGPLAQQEKNALGICVRMLPHSAHGQMTMSQTGS
jgi:hypothetical protein